jgi:peptidase M28-like protein
MMFRSTTLLAAALASAALTGPLAAQQTELPLKRAPRPTTAAITEADLMTRLYIFADDSMQGRRAGRDGNRKGNDYIARELRRLGVEPAGENGTYFQALPSVVRRYTNKSTLTVNGRALRWLTDFVAVPGNARPLPFTSAQVIYGGVAGDTTVRLTREDIAGKLVVLSPAPAGQRGRGAGGGGRGGGGRGQATPSPFAGAAAIATIDLDALRPTARAFINNPESAIVIARNGTMPPAPQPTAPVLRITTEAAALLLGAPVQGLATGATGATVTANLDFVEEQKPEYARNVIGIVRGSDPVLRNQYVAVGSHNDHVGFTNSPVDHDSARAYATEELRLRMAGGDLGNLTLDQRAGIRVNVDSLRRTRPARADSINNGADDDGSGSMAMLEIAEAIARAPTKPRRSIIFVWHTAEERGLLGAEYFTDNPTVPRDSIVAQVNMDMIGRGRATDIPGGGDDYLAVVGSKMLSAELGELVVSVNQKQQRPFRLDYRFDQPIDWQGYNNIYGRSDHARYARYYIPIAFFFTGLHQDYHRVTDEPQYIDYPHYTRITNYLRDLVVEVGNVEKRPVVVRPTTQ